MPGETVMEHVHSPELVLVELVGSAEIVDLDGLLAARGFDACAPRGKGIYQLVYFRLIEDIHTVSPFTEE
jgi:hypothetical protein